MRRLPVLLVLSSLAAAPALGAQTVSVPAPENPRRTLTRDELRERLEKKVEQVLEKVLPEKLRDDRVGRRKWLRKFQVIQSEHYLLYTNGPTSTVKKFAVSLEKLYDFAKEQFPFDDIERKLECYVFKAREDYFRFCVAVAGWDDARARRTAGHANALYYATFYQSPTADVVMHEATHQIVGACLKVSGVGSWFQEGMAVYVEKKIGNLDPSAGMRSDLRRGDYYPLADYVGIASLLFDPAGHGSRSYRHAGALIDFLVNTRLEPVAGRFGDFLAAARRGRGFGRGAESSAELVREVYGLSLDELEALWKKHHGVR